MADTDQSIPARTDQSTRLVEPPSPQSGQESVPAWSLPAALGVALLASLTVIYYRERITLLWALVAIGGALALTRLWKPLHSSRLASTILLVNLALVLVYFWSLDETHHVQIAATSAGLTATVDGDTTTLPIHPNGNGFGFQAGTLNTYRIQATGEAIQGPPQTLIDHLAATFRMAQPGTGWTNISEAVPDLAASRPRVFHSEFPAESWSVNQRNELAGKPGSYILFLGPSASTYSLSLDIVRPEGQQSLLVGVDKTGVGYALQLRFDQPDALWVRWQRGNFLQGVGGTGLHHLALVPEVQRVARLVLTGYLFALVFVALVIGLSLILTSLANWISEQENRIGGKNDKLADATEDPNEKTWSETFVQTKRFKWAFFTSVSVLGLLFTCLVSSLLLYRMPHVQDSVAYLFQAKMFAEGTLHVAAPAPQIQQFFQEEFMPFYQGKWFSEYPPGHPLMLMLGVLLGAPWLVEPVLAAVSLGCIFLLGRRLHGAQVGILAALLGLASPFWLFLGSSFMSHATGLFFVVTFMLCFARSEEERRRIWPFLAGLLAGMSFITRELTAVGVLGPFFLYALISFRRWRWAYMPAIAGAAIPLLFLLIYNWVQMGDPLRSTYMAWDPTFPVGFGNIPAAGAAFTPADGIWNIYQNLSMLSSQLYGWPYALALAFAFVPFMLGVAKRWDFLLLASFVGVGVYALRWAPGLMYGPRYYYEALPAVLLLTARGVFELARLPSRVGQHLGIGISPAVSASTPLALILALTIFNLNFYLPAQIPLYRGYNHSDDTELRAVSSANIHHAIVFVVTDSPVYWTSYGNVFFANDPNLSRGDIIYARDEGTGDSLLYRYFPGRSHYRLVGSHLTPIA